MATKALPTPDELRQLLRYEPDTGKLFWRERPASFFTDGEMPAEERASRWNKWRAGQEIAETVLGYKVVNCEPVLGVRRRIQAHRIIWLLETGEWPDGQVDHIDGNRANNLFSNLRVTDAAGNALNRALTTRNTSGIHGVRYNPQRKKWTAQIGYKGRSYNLGRFRSFEEAKAARLEAEQRLGFHPNHGDPSRPSYSTAS